VNADQRVLIIIPAWNEAGSIADVIAEVRDELPAYDILVVNDGSTDDTERVALASGARVVSLPYNLGVGGAMRLGYRYADENDYDIAVQLDADGQHDPRDVPQLVSLLDPDGPPQIVIGARFAGEGEVAVPRARRLAMRLLAGHLSRMTGVRLTDVTSGFRAHNRAALRIFARTYPADYLSDTVESLVIASRAGASISQVGVAMRPRFAGRSSQSAWRATAYLVRVLVILALAVIRRRPPSTEPEEGSP
jgi:glycosyltransferase involved in cell wall biosynthesis